MNKSKKLKRMRELIISVFHQNAEGKELLQLMTEAYCIDTHAFVDSMPKWYPAWIEGKRDLIRYIKHIIQSTLDESELKNSGENVYDDIIGI